MFRGSRASSTPRLTPNPPKCRPIPPKAPIFGCFHPMGLHFGHHTTSHRGLTTTKRGGNCIIRGATHRRHAASQLLMVQNPLASRSAEVRKVQPHREDSTRSEGVESSRSGVCLAVTRTFMNAEAYRYGGHRRNLRVQEGLAAAPMFPVAVPVAAAGSFLQISHAIPRSENTREFKTAEYQRSDFKPKIQSGELHEKLLRQSQGLATVLVATGTAPVTWRCTRYVALHPIRTGAMPTDRVHRTTHEYPKEESAAPHASPVDRNTRSHKNPKRRRCGGRRRDRRARLRHPRAETTPPPAKFRT